MAGNFEGILRELPDDNNRPDSSDVISVSEDSGFNSIAGPSFKDDAEGSFVGHDVKFRTVNVDAMAIAEKGKKRKHVDSAEAEAKKRAEEEYNKQKREQIYKRLMHLLSKSKFYSSYIIDKIKADDDKVKTKTKAGKPKKLVPETDENDEPPKRTQRKRRANNKYDVKDYVSSDMSKKLHDHKKRMNLSQDEIESELNSQSDSEEKAENGAEAVEATFVPPTYFTGCLRDYQIEGLQWLILLYKNGVNGILADEMGLGKTIQVIALFCDLMEKRQDGPYLIVAPLSTIPNWLQEFQNFAPNLPIVLFHGKPEARAAALRKMKRKQPVTDSYSTYPVVLTTYEVPLVESTVMRSFKWRYIVVDEGHRIKNHKCQLVGVLNTCESMNRLLLTGTPLQNNLSELWSLLNFLLPEIFDDLAIFESWFDAKELQENEGTQKVLKQEEEKHVLSTLREILKPFMLRRVKSEVCLDIPAKKELIVYAPMTQLQYDLYAAVLNHDLHVLSKIEEEKHHLQVTNEGETHRRRKRLCRMNNKYSSDYVDIYNTSEQTSSRSNSPVDGYYEMDAQWREDSLASNSSVNKTSAEKSLDVWRQYTDINVRNQDFFVRLRFGSRGIMYKQIVNHPFLLHCPLDDTGLPEISENMVTSSGKLLVLDAMLKKLKAGGHKVLLFSTMTMILDLIADYLSLRPWRFLMLTGKHKIEVRQETIKLFNTDPDVFLFLISTRAGGVGLNLAAADTVIIYDSDWNPQCDLQAMARCHRIGQTRPVVVYRMCTKGTVDEKIISRAEAKRKLEKMVISKGVELGLKNLNDLQELKRLLDTTECTVVTAEKEVYTDAELDKILDRSDLMSSAPSATADSVKKLL